MPRRRLPLGDDATPPQGLRQDLEPSYVPVLRLLILRILIRGGIQNQFVSDSGFESTAIALLLGFTPDEVDDFDRAAACRRLRQMHEKAERGAIGSSLFPADTAFSHNIALLGQELGLGGVEQDVLHFLAMERVSGELSDTVNLLGGLSLDRVIRLLAEALDAPRADVRAALDAAGRLTKMGLISVDKRGRYNFRGKIDTDDAFPDELSVRHDSVLQMFSRHCVAARPSTLALADYPHIAADADILKAYLADAIAKQRSGVNVLVHGRPGTGKSEFVRALAQEIKASLFEVAVQEPDGDPKPGKQRFNAFRLSQTLLAKAPSTLLLFDEVEDVFAEPKAMPWDQGNASGLKGWVNQLLETNPVPTLWITNRLGALDPAYRRRFDFVLHLDVPPRSVRRRVLDRCLTGLPISDHWREDAANHPHLAPALIDRAAKVVGRLQEAGARVSSELAMTRTINNALDALGRSPVNVTAPLSGVSYRLEYVNADCDLAQLQDGLRSTGEARICLYGPPGTGKTEFGRHLARLLDRPLLVKRASEILGPYVGMTERNLAQMFEEAEADKAVLLLDEADSFLQDRRSAQRSWEITQVNEMLTQMESFRGIFIASTNLMENLDAASLRRFDAKIKLDYMTPDQVWALFSAFLSDRSVPLPFYLRGELGRLMNVTPGDFAAVARRLRLIGTVEAKAVVKMLAEECALKRDGRGRAIGFA